MDRDLRNRLDVTLHVGKDGMDEGLVAELDIQLKRNHLVKVRIQRGAVGGDRHSEQDLAEMLTQALGAELVERRGHTVLIYRRRKVRLERGSR